MVPRVRGNEWHMYSDSDHAGDTATGTNRSHTGVMIMLNGMPMHWRSNKQPTPSLSSAEAEIYAISTAVKDARTRLWIAEELNLKVEWPLVLHVDNAAGESFQHSTKHSNGPRLSLYSAVATQILPSRCQSPG